MIDWRSQPSLFALPLVLSESKETSSSLYFTFVALHTISMNKQALNAGTNTASALNVYYLFLCRFL